MQFTSGQRTRMPDAGDSREVPGTIAAVDGSWVLFISGAPGLPDRMLWLNASAPGGIFVTTQLLRPAGSAISPRPSAPYSSRVSQGARSLRGA